MKTFIFTIFLLLMSCSSIKKNYNSNGFKVIEETKSSYIISSKYFKSAVILKERMFGFNQKCTNYVKKAIQPTTNSIIQVEKLLKNKIDSDCKYRQYDGFIDQYNDTIIYVVTFNEYGKKMSRDWKTDCFWCSVINVEEPFNRDSNYRNDSVRLNIKKCIRDRYINLRTKRFIPISIMSEKLISPDCF